MQVLITMSRGIIESVVFFNNPQIAVQALSEFVRNMNVEWDDGAVYDPDGLIANAKHFLDVNEKYMENQELIEEISKEENQSIYIIGNPKHPLGFMVTSPDDPLGYKNPVEALSDLGQMREDYGNHLKLYQVEPVTGPVAERNKLEKYNVDLEIEDFDYSLIEEYLF